MLLKKRILLIFVAILMSVAGWAHTSLKDTIIKLEDIEIKTSRLKNFGLGLTVEHLSATLINRNSTLSVTDLLSSYSDVSIRSYGPGGIASMSMRGGNAAHTSVLWNGLNIQSPMSGMSNLASLPSFLITDVTIQRGGAGTLYGSGAMGGVVHISSLENFNQKNNISFLAGFGSFNRQDYVFKAKTGDSTYAFTMKFYIQSAENNFVFTNTTQLGSPKETQTNAGMRGYGFMPGLSIITSKNSILNISALYQKYSKDIQTMMTDLLPNQDNQADVNLYLTANWKYIGDDFSLNYKSGIINQKITLTDQSLPNPDEEPLAVNIAGSIINEIESKIFIKENHALNVGLNYTHETGESFGYLEKSVRNRVSLFSSYKINQLYPGLNTALSLRYELSKNNSLPLTFSLGADYSLTDFLKFKGNVSRNYRIPAFNDLFWKPDTYAVGNPELTPESGYSGEIGMIQRMKTGNAFLELSQTFFANSIKDLIIWLPGPTGIWMPDNKEKSKTVGIELRADARYKINESLLSFKTNYSWTNARIFSSEGDLYDDTQLIYVPKHRLMSTIGYNQKDVFINFTFNHTGERNYDHTHTLSAYQAGNLDVNYKFPVKGNQLTASFRINNLWNTDYQSIAWYAMPGRNFHLALKIQINTMY